MLFCNCRHVGQLATTHSILCYFVLCLFFNLFDEDFNDIIVCWLVGFIVLVQSLYYTGYFDDQHMGLVVVIQSLMVFNEHKFNARFWCTQSGRWRKNAGFCCKSVDAAHSFVTCQFEAYAKSNYPGRHISLSFWQMKNVDHRCEWSLVTTLFWVEVIHHTIFLMRPVFFWYIANEVKDLWFDIGYNPTDYSYMKIFIEYFVDIAFKYYVGGCLYGLHRFQLIFYTRLIYSLNISFDHHICCCFIFYNNFNFFIDQNSQLDRFLTRNILIV